MFGDGIFNQEGPSWKHSRELLRAPLQHKNYENLDVFRQGVDDLIDVLSSQSAVIDLQPLFFRLTLDVATEFLFGESVNSLKAPNSASKQTFGEAFNTAQETVAQRFRFPDLYRMIGGSKFRKACKDVHCFADEIITRNLSRSSRKSRVFLDAVAESTADRDALKGQIINLLVAGRDTTACLLTWTFFLLVRHSMVLEKLRTEIDSNCFDPASLTRADLRKMSYLRNVLNETLRLYPSVPVNNRVATRTTLLPTGGGPDGTAPVLIPKGSTVSYSVYAMHRRPDLYGLDAELFRPERWNEDMPMRHDKINATWGYLPFNGGPRTCIGCKSQVNLKNRGKYSDFFSSGLRTDRSRVYSCPAPSSFPRHTITSGPKGRDHRCREADHDSCAFVYGRLHCGLCFWRRAGTRCMTLFSRHMTCSIWMSFSKVPREISQQLIRFLRAF